HELGLPAHVPDGAFYLMVDVGSVGCTIKVAEAMLEEGVITVPGSAFGQESENYLRISFCAEPDVLLAGVSKMKQAIQKLKG
ncbi:MAG: aminotransferase class I/II-fold pyridoxal phosphate-dependent enzyme, partial [Pyrinomonadaceae bacterium]